MKVLKHFMINWQYGAYISTLNAAYPGNAPFFNSLTLATELRQYPARIVTQSERLALQQQALTNETFAAYARSLYYKLTNTLVLPNNTGFPTTIRSRNEIKDAEEIYKIGPNPIVDNLNVSIENFKSDKVYHYEIYSSMGTLIKKGILLNETQIELSNISSGFNIIKIMKEDNVVLINRFISTR